MKEIKKPQSAIKKILDQETYRQGLEYHQLRYRESGNVLWLEFHLLFPKNTLLEDSHKIATEIEMKLKTDLNANVNVITHLEPLEIHNEIHSETHN